ncbi:hypothetical protein ACFPFV_08140 [Salinicoccus siamensis]
MVIVVVLQNFDSFQYIEKQAMRLTGKLWHGNFFILYNKEKEGMN